MVIKFNFLKHEALAGEYIALTRREALKGASQLAGRPVSSLGEAKILFDRFNPDIRINGIGTFKAPIIQIV